MACSIDWIASQLREFARVVDDTDAALTLPAHLQELLTGAPTRAVGVRITDHEVVLLTRAHPPWAPRNPADPIAMQYTLRALPWLPDWGPTWGADRPVGTMPPGPNMLVAHVTLQPWGVGENTAYGCLNIVPAPGPAGTDASAGAGSGTSDLPMVLFHFSPRLSKTPTGHVTGALVTGLKLADGSWKTQRVKPPRQTGTSLPVWAGEATVEVRIVVVVGHGLGRGGPPPVGLALYLDEVFMGVRMVPPGAVPALGTAHVEVPLGGDAREANNLVVHECCLGRRPVDSQMLQALAGAVEEAAPITGKFLVEGVPPGLDRPLDAVAALFAKFAKTVDTRFGGGDRDMAVVVTLTPVCNAELRDVILAELGNNRAFVSWYHPDTGHLTRVYVKVTYMKA